MKQPLMALISYYADQGAPQDQSQKGRAAALTAVILFLPGHHTPHFREAHTLTNDMIMLLSLKIIMQIKNIFSKLIIGGNNYGITKKTYFGFCCIRK